MTQSVNHYEDWLPMGEVTERTGMSERTVYRMVTEGKLKQAQRPIPGRRPLPVFDPHDVEELAAATLKARPQMISNETAIAPVRMLADAIRSAAHPEEQADDGLPLSELAHKVYLTTAEAVRYSGVTVDVLAEMVEKKKVHRLESMRPFRYRRTDLEKL
jgi:predicted DNA-binding transcriptional regulator AlpA